jgi:RHS repeat-associated protein
MKIIQGRIRVSMALRLGTATLGILLILTPLTPAFAQTARSLPVATPSPAASPSTPANPSASPAQSSPVSAKPSAPAGTAQTPSPSPSAPVPAGPNNAPAAKAGAAGLQASALTSAGGATTPGTTEPEGTSPAQTVQPKTDLNSGALSFDYPITLPPGRSGFTPDLALKYNSQHTDNSSIIGYGWELSIPYIVRKNTHGVDQLYNRNDFTSSEDGDLKLISTTGSAQTLFPQSQTSDFSKYTLDTSTNTWKLTNKTGTVFTFGDSTASREDDPANLAHIYKWMLSSVTDTNGNTVSYTYTKDQNKIYPLNIHYAIFDVGFSTESRADAITSYAQGFAVTNGKRIYEIAIYSQGDWTKKYTFGYSAGDNTVRSMLQSVTESGKDNLGVITTKSPTTMAYSHATPWRNPDGTPNGDTYSGSILTGARAPVVLDLNGDSYSDIIEGWVNGSQVVSNAFINNTVQTYSNQSVYRSISPSPFISNPALIIPNNGVFTEPENRNGLLTYFPQGYLTGDVNGDLLPDLIQNITPPTFNNSFINLQGSSWSTNNINWNTALPVEDRSLHIFTDVNGNHGNLIDLNDDGLNDYLHDDTTRGVQWQRNTGTGFAAPQTINLPAVPSTFYNYPPIDDYVDINGDGLIDYLHSSISAYLNDGNLNWVQNIQLKSPMIQPGCYMCSASKFIYIDINGDGLVDIVPDTVSRVGASDNFLTYINTGNGWVASPQWNNPAGNAYAVAQLNGDGLPDFMVGDAYNVTNVILSRGTMPDLLSSVTLPTGGKVDVTYKSSAQYRDASGNLSNPKLPFIVQTVNAITTTDAVNNISSTNTYTYSGGSYFINPTDVFDRKFAGFNKVTETDPAGDITTTYYHQGNASDSSRGEYNDDEWKIGKPYRVETANSSGNIFSETINQWDDFDLGNGSKFVKLAQAVDYTYDGDSTHKDKAVSYTYDNANGSVIQKTEYGEVMGNDDGTFVDVGNDDFTTTYAYASNSSVSILSLPDDVTTTDHNGIKVKESRFYYDNLPLGQLTLGNQTKEEDWKNGIAYINTQKIYNSYGLVTQSTDANGNAATYVYDTFNLYPASITNALNQITNLTYDYSSGQVTQKTDPNGRIFQFVYDGLGRLLSEKQPDITTPSTLVTKSSYVYTDIPNAVSVQKTEYLNPTTAGETYQYYDGLDRLIQERKEAEVGNFEVTDKVYNNRGLLDKESLPYFSFGFGKVAPTSTASLYTNYAYDPMGRVTTTANNLGVTTNSYNDWKLTVTDANGKAKDLTKDAYGNLVQVDEHNSGNTYSTHYTYDYLGDLTNITDPLGNIRTFTYNGLGRRLTAQDLHAPADTTFGTYTYTYDDAGNLTSRLDPNSQTTNYTYDNLNRPLTEDFTGQPGTEVTYAYDAGVNGIGHLTGVTTAAITQTNMYNAVGGLQSESKVINGATYTTAYDYDTQGNQILITNPDGSQVKNTYNPAGLLESTQRKEATDTAFTDVVSNYDYSPTDQPATIAYANGSVTTNTYDPAKLYRLVKKVTTIAGGDHAQDLSYTYDNDGNITQILDASNTDTAKTATYAYDDLNRLTSAAITAVAPGQSEYAQSYSYNAIGDILSRTETIGTSTPVTYAYAYEGNTGGSFANPHGVTSISDGTNTTAFTYDNNGNELTRAADLTNIWDYNNRLIQVSAKTFTDVYAYDASGERIMTDSTKHTASETPIVLSKVHIESSNADPTLAKAGDSVTLSFGSPVGLMNPAVTIAQHPVTVSTSSTAAAYTATYTLANDDTAGAVAFTIDYADANGNPALTVTTTTDASSVSFNNSPLPAPDPAPVPSPNPSPIPPPDPTPTLPAPSPVAPNIVPNILNLNNSTTLDLSAGLIPQTPIDVNAEGTIMTVAKSIILHTATTGDPVVISNSDLTGVNLTIPDGTNIQGPTLWDGNIIPPKTSTISTSSSGFQLAGRVIEVGSPGNILVMDKPAIITISDSTGPVAYQTADATAWIALPTCDGTYENPTPPSSPNACSLGNNTSTKIVTYHFSTFGVNPLTVKVLVVGGGGGGGTGAVSPSIGAGSGGAGGYQYNPAFPVTPQAYSVTVGSGGAGGISGIGNTTAGGNSIFDIIIALGGGSGGQGGGGGSIGGSGGGAAGGFNSAGGIGSQGNNGGTNVGSTAAGGGGGGGSTSSGANNFDGTGGIGGSGTANSISGSFVTYATGADGGGIGTGNGTAGAANTGNGGRGGGSGATNGGAGGSGVVIISYATDGSDGVSPSSTGGTVTTIGGQTIHTFIGSGAFTVVAATFTPTVTTQAVSSTASSSITGNGNVMADGGSAITERGVVWSPVVFPTIADSKITVAGTTGLYSATITGLTGSTLYHYRAYAINAIGTSYGADIAFTTTAEPAPIIPPTPGPGPINPPSPNPFSTSTDPGTTVAATVDTVKTASTTVTTVYPSKFYNTDGTTATKHIFGNGVEIGTVTGTGADGVARYVSTDHLTGSSVTTNSAGAKEEVLDYYPYGSVRLDAKSGNYGDQREYAGSEFDADTGLNYMNARYYDSATGRFVSEDPVFLALGTKGSLSVLANPQALNSYSYATNNPLVNVDSDGNFAINIFSVLPSSAQRWIENQTYNASLNNAGVRFALDHPFAVGAGVGLAAGVAIVAAPAVGEVLTSSVTMPQIVRGSIGAGMNVASTYLESKAEGRQVSAAEYVFSGLTGAGGANLNTERWLVQSGYAMASNGSQQLIFKNSLDPISVGLSGIAAGGTAKLSGMPGFSAYGESLKSAAGQIVNFTLENPVQSLNAVLQKPHVNRKK